MTPRIFSRAFWDGPTVYGLMFLGAIALLAFGIFEPKLIPSFGQREPRHLSKAEEAWGARARQHEHERRVCGDRDAVMSAQQELQGEMAWRDDPNEAATAATKSLNAAAARRDALLQCLGIIAPLPPPPPNE